MFIQLNLALCTFNEPYVHSIYSIHLIYYVLNMMHHNNRSEDRRHLIMYDLFLHIAYNYLLQTVRYLAIHDDKINK